MYSLTKHAEIEASNMKLIQRSIRSRALYKGDSYSLASLYGVSEDGPLRRVHSAGDMEVVSSCIAKGNEKSMIMEGTMKASRYSPEEKRERIHKYRCKRNLRNFKRKIQYECRKALADSRARFKGRFVRNGEISTMTTATITTHQKEAREDEDGEGKYDDWINLLDNYYS